MLNGTRAANAQPPARGPPSAQAPSKVGVHIYSKGDPLVLPQEVVDSPRARNQVTRQSDQRRPVRGGG
eukprot:3579165-Alexandrium_andersonii.AAC.1